jgi:ABC-type glycerol-3-phosphate transport system substrate-binding protein
MKRAAAALLLFGLATTVVMAGTKVQVQSKPAFNFASLKTWAWNPSGPGDVKVWVTANSKSEPVKRQYEPVLVKAVEDELTRLGLVKASGAPPDFLVTYYMLITVGSSAQQLGQFLPNVTEWGLPPFTAQTTALSVYPMGTLVLDVASPDVDHVVWRAVAQAEIDLEKTEAQRAVRIKNVVHDVLAKLPRKNKK